MRERSVCWREKRRGLLPDQLRAARCARSQVTRGFCSRGLSRSSLCAIPRSQPAQLPLVVMGAQLW